MYVRWKRRATTKKVIIGHQRKVVDGHYVTFERDGKRYYETVPVRESQPTGEYIITAQLVESHRRDGKPRQKVIKHLGSVNESCIHYIGHRIGFWRAAGAAFKALNLLPEQQHAIEQTLHARVPFPTPEDAQKARDEMNALTASIRSKM